MKEKVFSIEHGPDDTIVFSFKQPKFEFALNARGHIKTASKETLLAFRSIIDDVIAHIESKEEKGRKQKKAKIEIE